MAETTDVTNSDKTAIKTWRSRRRMAIAALAWLILETLLLFYTLPVDKITALNTPITSSYYVMGGIVAAYMGFKAFGKDEMKS